MIRRYMCKCGHVRTSEGCGACDRHSLPPKGREPRGTATERGYDYRWNKFSLWYRSQNPLCRDCLEEGIVTPSAEVHHVRKLADAPKLKYEYENLMALCSNCHKIRTGRGE